MPTQYFVLREYTKLSQKEAAHALGMNLKRLKAIEKGKIEPTKSEQLSMANLYHCKVEDFKSGEAMTSDEVKKAKSELVGDKPFWSIGKNNFVVLILDGIAFALELFGSNYQWPQWPMVLILVLAIVLGVGLILFTAHTNKKDMGATQWCLLVLPHLVMMMVLLLAFFFPDETEETNVASILNHLRF